jgi:hypothetical protein
VEQEKQGWISVLSAIRGQFIVEMQTADIDKGGVWTGRFPEGQGSGGLNGHHQGNHEEGNKSR